MLWVGIAAFFILLHYLASYIWFVDVAGVKTLDREKILAVAQAQGLQPGVPRQRLQPKLLENHLRSALPELAWVGVSAQGSRVVIEVVEKTAAQEEDKAPAHIVAGKDGIIVETIALAGTAVVGRGTTVKRGDIVIRGEVAETEVPGTQAKEPVPLQKIIRAKGIVKARVWYEGYGEAQTEEELWQRTGTYVSAVTARIGPWQAVLNRPAGQPFSHYELETVQKIFPNWRNSEFTVESTIHTYYELQASKLIRSESEARELARERALASVRQKIPEAAQILANDVTVMKTADPKLVRVTARVETIEDIGEAQLITNP